MKSYDLVIYSEYSASIMMDGDIFALNQPLWDKLFANLTYVFDQALFSGYLENFITEDFDKNVNFVAEHVFVNEPGPRRKLLF